MKHCVLRRLKLVVGKLHRSRMECALLPLLEPRLSPSSVKHTAIMTPVPKMPETGVSCHYTAL